MREPNGKAQSVMFGFGRKKDDRLTEMRLQCLEYTLENATYYSCARRDADDCAASLDEVCHSAGFVAAATRQRLRFMTAVSWLIDDIRRGVPVSQGQIVSALSWLGYIPENHEGDPGCSTWRKP